MLDYQYAPIARRDEQAIISYFLYERNSPTGAADFVDRLNELVDKIREMPYMGRTIDSERLENDHYRKFSFGKFFLYYYVDEDGEQIIICRILHQRRNLVEQEYFDLADLGIEF